MRKDFIACANAITSGSVLGNLAILKFLLAVLRTVAAGQ
jgi:hypothetical protein